MQPGEYEIMFQAEETHWWYRALHRFLFANLDELLPDWPTKTILDAGCGTGTILKLLGNPGRNIGVDLAPEAIALCRKRGLTNARQADICALPFPDSSFDAVICSSVLYHRWVADVGSAVRELGRVLRPEGLLLINLPAFSFLHSAHDEAVLTARRFRKSQVRSLLVESRFTVQRLTYWTTLLFPLAVVARTLGASKTGRDFDGRSKPNSPIDLILSATMSFELGILKIVSLPFGVALFAAATKGTR